MIIDVHGHIGYTTPGAARPAHVTTYAGVCNVDLVLVSNRDAASASPGAADLDEAAANVACLDACRAYGRLAPVYWIRPGRTDSHVPALVGALQTEPFVAAALAPAENDYEPEPRLLGPYLAALTLVSRPLLVCVSDDDRTAPAKLHALAVGHPRLPVVLCACGASTGRRAELLDLVRRAVHRDDARLYLDTSHATADAIRQAVYAVGAERLLFGTHAVAYDDAHIPRHIALLDELRRALLPAEYAQLTGGNATRLLGLDRAAQ